MIVKEIEPPREISKESIAHYIAKIASVVYDRDGVKNEVKRLDQLMVEAYGSRPSSVLAFVPCVVHCVEDLIDIHNLGFQNKLFGYFGNNGFDIYYTNMRELLMWGLDFDQCLEYVDFENFHTVKCVAPYMIAGQLFRHQTMAMVSHSQRMAVSNHGYWYPSEYPKWIEDSGINIITQVGWDNRVRNSSPNELKSFMKKELGIKRKEIYDRGSDMLENRTFCLGGYTNNEYQWDWMYRQRILDTHTQIETRELMEKIRDTMMKGETE